MPAILDQPVASMHRERLEIGRPVLAKADLKNLEMPTREAVGQAVARARLAVGWSLKQLAGACEQATGEARDIAQLSRWESGRERPLFDVLFAIGALSGPLVIELARLSAAVEVVTEIRVRRGA